MASNDKGLEEIPEGKSGATFDNFFIETSLASWRRCDSSADGHF